jgi:Protein of unknown function (DUF4232)
MFKRFGIMGGFAPLALVSAGAVLALSGCVAQSAGTQGGGSGAVGGVSASAAPVDGASGQGGGSGQSSGGSGTQGGGQNSGSGSQAAACTTANLSLSTGDPFSSGPAGGFAQPIVLQNAGSTPCTVLGWPGLAALNGGDSQIYQAMRVGSEGSPITLQPGGYAAAVIYTVTTYWPPNSEDPACAPVPKLLVTPPNETHPMQTDFGKNMCVAPALTALTAGSSGSSSASAAAEYAEAVQLWKAGANAADYIQGAYWDEAQALLGYTATSGASGSTGFATASQELNKLALLPDAMRSSTQQAQYSNYVSSLNSFFNTPALYS